jgi:hypothetical protein
MIPFPESRAVRARVSCSVPVYTGTIPDSLQMLAAEKHKGTFLAPVGIGLSLFIAELAGMFPTRTAFESRN